MAYIELDRSAFFYNLDIIAQQTRGVDKVALVLKDNAYGHGLEEMAAMASEYGVTKAVVRNDAEAHRIADRFEYILVLAEIPKAASERVRYTVNALEQIPRFPKGCRVEIKVDTGMHRNGITVENLEAVFQSASDAGLIIEGLFTHHRSADVNGSEWRWQKEQFDAVKVKARDLAKTYGFETPRFHSCNSAALFRNRAFDEEMARVGIAAYGCLEMEAPLEQPVLRPVLSLYAERIATRVLASGQRVGYNGIYEASKEEEVSTYDVGYADGMLRAASNRFTTPEGIALRGRISMDNSSFATTKEELLVFNNANDYAAAAGTIGYEVLVGMRPHLKRIVKN